MRYRGYLFDLDGTLFRGDEPIASAVEKVRELHEAGAVVRYVTNNSTQTRDHFAKKLTKMGYRAEPGEVVSSGVGTARLLSDWGVKTAYVVGEAGLVSCLAECGVTSVTEGPAEVVVVGLCRQFTYDMMREAMLRIRGGARFVATNPDPTFPIEGGGQIPGAGSCVAGIQMASGVEPFIVGKPSPYLTIAALEDGGLKPEEAVVVGDRMDTDIESGRRAGCDTFLVLTGVATEIPAGQAGGADLSKLE